MEKLENYGVQEMNTSEMQKADGGLGFWAAVGAGILIGAAVEIIQNWGDFKDGFVEGYTD
jgi:hypothetical protein